MFHRFGKSNIVLLAFAFILNISCDNKKKSMDYVANPTKININNKITPSENLIQLVDVISLESNDLSRVGEFTRLIVYDSCYYLLDDKFNRTVLKFNSNGNFERSFGSIGQGPGEYSRARWFSVSGIKSELAIFVANERKLLIYNLIDGTLKRTVPLHLQAQSFEYIPNGGFVFYTSFTFYKPLIKSKIQIHQDDSYQVITTDEDGKITGFAIPYPESYQPQNFMTDWSVFSPFCDELSMFCQYVDTLFSFGPSGTLIPKYLIDYGNDNQVLSTKYCNDLGPNPVIDFQRNSALRKTSNIYRLLDQFQTESHIHLVGLNNTRVFRFLIDKGSGNVIDLQENNNLVLRFGFRASDCQYFYSLAFASAFKKDKNGIVSNKYPEKLKNIVIGASNEDNPILLVWKVSRF